MIIIMQQHWELYVRLLVAIVIGASIGLERAYKNKDAGIRTHSLVCLGSALIMILSAYDSSPEQMRDPMRLAAQVVSGIGFIGAGVIWMDKRNVKRGLTTAASVWVTSALGLTVGYGLLDIAIFACLLLFIALNIPKVLRILGIHQHDNNEE